MKLHHLLLPLLIGCAASDLALNEPPSSPELVSSDSNASEVSPAVAVGPPVMLTLGASNLIPGHPFSLTVTGAPPNGNVVFVRASATGSACPPQLGGLCLGLSNPSLLGTIVANAQGIASWNANIAASVPVGTTQFFQAVYVGPGAATSPVTSSTAVALCGDAIVQTSEQCDDGNMVAGDGCENSCRATLTNSFKVTIENARIRNTDPGGGQWDDFAVIPPFTNPDPFVEVRVANFVVGQTVTREDTFRPSWNASLTVTVNPGESLGMVIIDEEPAGVLNEVIGTVTLTYNELQAIKNLGTQTATGGSLTSFNFNVTDP